MGNDTKKFFIAGLIAFAVGIGLGLLYGWVIQPVEWVDATPKYLRSDLQVDYMNMVVDSLRVTGDQQLAASRYYLLEEDGPAALAIVRPNQDPATMAVFDQALAAYPPPAPVEVESRSWLGTIVLILAVFVVLFVIVGLVYYLFRGKSSPTGEKTAAAQGIEYSKQVQKTDYTSMGEDAPVAQYVTTYMLGDDLFDDSFSIDSPAGEFLGECGVGISEIVGVGDPKKVTAFEVWIFDKNDIQTVTKVLMSPHAFNDPALQAKLESKGELVEIRPGSQVALETATLQMAVSVSSADFGQGPLPPESYFERLTLELAIWTKS